MFYRELGVDLQRIKAIIDSPAFDSTQALREHRQQLLAQRARLDVLICNVEKTIAHMEGGRTMSDQEKFAGFKKKLIEDNEKKFGQEARARGAKRQWSAAIAPSWT